MMTRSSNPAGSSKTILSTLHQWGRAILNLLLWGAAGILLVILVVLIPAFYRNLVTFPSLERQLAELETSRRPPAPVTSLNDFKGVLHAHNEWSHDSRGVLAEIIPAAKQAELDFIFFTDHPRTDIDCFPRSYHGTFDDILIISGAEKQRMLVWPLDSLCINWQMEPDSIIRRVVQHGGLVVYAHSERPHHWGNPDFQGMEIYNIHTDIKDEAMWKLLPDLIVNKKRYHRWIFRSIFDEQRRILALWDSLNTRRRVVGISANDAHNNQNIRARWLEPGTVEWVGPNADTWYIGQPAWWQKWLFSPPDTAGWIFKWEIDPYFESFRFVNTHILADRLTPRALAEHLKQGHAYIAFESLASADGFQFFATRSGKFAALMGDSLRFTPDLRLHAESPLPGRIRLVKNGVVIQEQRHTYTAVFSVQEAGIYRGEVALQLDGRWVPWIYTNPIYIFH